MPTVQIHAYESITRISQTLRKMEKPRVLQAKNSNGRNILINCREIVSVEETPIPECIVSTTDGKKTVVQASYADIIKAWLDEE